MGAEKLLKEGLMKMNGKGIPLLLQTVAVCFPSFADDPVESLCPPGVVFEALALNRDLPTLKKPKYLSPTDLVPSADGMLLFVAQQTAKRIDVVDVGAGIVVRRIQLPNEVTGIAAAPGGGIIYATCSSDLWPAGMVCVVDVSAGRVTAQISVGHGARAPVITPDGAKLYVCNRFDNDLSVVDLSTGKETCRVRAVREPYCADITPDGKMLVVGNLLPDDLSTDTNDVASKISLIDVATNAIITDIRLRRGSHNVQGVAVSVDGKYAFATHVIGVFNMYISTCEKGWANKNDIAVIDLAEKKLINEVSLDLSVVGMGNPWGIRCSKDGEYMVVAHAGANELSIIRLKDMIKTVLDSTAAGKDLQKHFAIMIDSRKRVQVNTKGPRALAVNNDKVYTAGYFNDTLPSIEVFQLSLSTKSPFSKIVLGEPQQQTAERQGEALFYDAQLSFQTWHSCHSCHTFSRIDGLNRILGGGVVTAPKNTKSLVHSWWTPPTTWMGRRGHAQQAIVAAIELELFRVPTQELVDPIEAFFMGIKPMTSPRLVKGRLLESARRGRAIYYDMNKVDCRKCHPAPLFTDSLLWNTGVPDPFDANTQWVTPSLIESWRTAPYNHLGSMTMRQMVELPTMGNASANLTAQEIDDLVAYVRSL